MYIFFNYLIKVEIYNLCFVSRFLESVYIETEGRFPKNGTIHQVFERQ